MRFDGALAGVRVLDLCGDVGRFATKLLAEAGAAVVKVAGWGERGAPMADPDADAQGGVLDWWYDGGKTSIAWNPEAVARLASVADLVVDDRPAGWLNEHGLDLTALRAVNPRLVHVSLTPFGGDGPRADWRTSDLVAGALGGVLSVTGTEDAPLNSFGRQNFHFGSFYAVICALAGLQQARRTRVGCHVDVSLHEVVTASIEHLLFPFVYDDLLPLPKVAVRAGALHWLGAYDVVPARTGAVMVTPTPDAVALFDWLVAEGVPGAAELAGLDIAELLARMPEVMTAIRTFCLRHDADWLFREAQARHVAFGEVQSVPTIAANPQFAHRGFFEPVDWDGPEIRRPAHPFRLRGTPAPPLRPPPAEVTSVEEVAAAWGAVDSPVAAPSDVTPGRKPLDGIRICDLTWVLAGPFCTRILGDLGADVCKFQNVERATLVNQDHYPYYPWWNRSKRSALLDFKHPDAVAAIRPIIEQSDVLIENYAAGVVDRWGLDWETVHAWNPRLIYVSMSGCGHEGPWQKIISYAPTVHALCGLTYLTNPPDRRDVGCGFSLNDHAAGFAAATAVLQAIEARERTGEGQYVDMAQLEVGSFLVGPALLDFFANGRVAEPVGNADGYTDHPVNDVFRCADGRFVAITAFDDADADRLRTVVGSDLPAWCATLAADDAADALQAAGIAAGAVQDAADLIERDPQHAARGFWRAWKDHPLYGDRLHEAFPARWSTTDLEPYLRSPYFGEHSFEIYGELAGRTDEEIAIGIADGLFT